MAIVVVLSECGGATQANAILLTRRAPGQTALATPTAVGIAKLSPQPGGPADLIWTPTNSHTLTVTLSVTGLAPANPASYASEPYPAEIGSGSCQHPGKVVHHLKAVTADHSGAGKSTTTIKGVAGGIPAKGWHIALRAPAAANQQGTVLACAPVANPHASLTQKQSVSTRLHGGGLGKGKEGVEGGARLSLSGTTLTVSVMVAGLAPGSEHEAHIHVGSCDKQGPVAHPLEMITADAHGLAYVETTIQGVNSIPGNWYIQIHDGTDLKTQTGYQSIACGDVFTGA